MTTDVIPPTTSVHKNLKKPDDTAHKKFLEDLNSKIDSLKKQQDAVKAKINKLGGGKSDNTRREELKAQLGEIREKQAEIKGNRQAVYVQLDALNDSIRKKVGNVKAFQTKVPFKTTEEVDDRIRELEEKIERGVRLVEEKKILQEISTLKRGRSQVEGLDEQQEAITRERNIYNGLKQQIDDGESKKLSEQYDVLNEELRTLLDEGHKQYEERNKLYTERNRIKGLLDEAYNTLRTSRDEFRKSNDEYYTAVRELREARREKEHLQKIQAEAEKRQEVIRQELELASLPAFEHEITLCDNLGIYLESFLAKSANQGEESAKATQTAANNAPEGFVLKKKDEDEVFFVGSKNNKKKNNKANKEKKVDTLKLPLATMENFFEVKVTVPTKISEIPATLEKLKDRKAQYIKDQPHVTEENKKKAEAKLAAAEEESAQEVSKDTNADEIN
ncbi:hypothetical protein K501DRAFT_321005 [Backusella circina FSU 941]|nr:hypothetical protein K501DRAFT_321005 [Backusella circina FSU 941]